MKQQFVMSKYMSKETLYKDKAKYYLDRSEQLESCLKDLSVFVSSNYILNDVVADILWRAGRLINEEDNDEI